MKGSLNNFPIGSADDPLGLDSLNQDLIIPEIEENEFSEKSNIPQNLNDPLGLDEDQKKNGKITGEVDDKNKQKSF